MESSVRLEGSLGSSGANMTQGGANSKLQPGCSAPCPVEFWMLLWMETSLEEPWVGKWENCCCCDLPLPKACALLQLLMSLTCWRKDREENCGGEPWPSQRAASGSDATRGSCGLESATRSAEDWGQEPNFLCTSQGKEGSSKLTNIQTVST